MKKQMIIVSLMIVFLSIMFAINVYAAEPQITITGDDKITQGGTKELKVSISSDIEIGVVSGKVSNSANITKITVTGENDWSLTYNKNTGKFNIIKPEGAKKETIMKITYTVGDSAGVGTVTLEDLKLSTIEYNTFNKENVTKNITIEKTVTEPENKPTTEPENKPVTEPENKPTTEPENKPATEPENKPTTELENEKEAEKPTIKGIGNVPEKFPKTGFSNKAVIILTSVFIVTIFTSIIYLKKYKNI